MAGYIQGYRAYLLVELGKLTIATYTPPQLNGEETTKQCDGKNEQNMKKDKEFTATWL